MELIEKIGGKCNIQRDNDWEISRINEATIMPNAGSSKNPKQEMIQTSHLDKLE